ncbi:unnamed protein product, partial [Heterotrigona itama]
DRVFLTEENERRWNTPPELIPEQLIKTSNAKNGRSLSIPITTNINVNTGNNAYSLGFQLRPEGVSYSESNSFNHPLSGASGSISQSQSVSFSAGVSQHYPTYGNQGNINSQTVGFGSAAASSSSSNQNGHATSAIMSSKGMIIRFPGQSQNRPIWTNIRPNNNNNNGHHSSRMPKLNITIKPQHEQNHGPIKLHVSAHGTRWNDNQSKIHIHKWQHNSGNYDDDERR